MDTSKQLEEKLWAIGVAGMKRQSPQEREEANIERGRVYWLLDRGEETLNELANMMGFDFTPTYEQFNKIAEAQEKTYQPADIAMMDTSYCPKHKCMLVMAEYGNVDAGRDCPECAAERRAK